MKRKKEIITKEKRLSFIAWCKQFYIENKGISLEETEELFRKGMIAEFLFDNYEVERLVSGIELIDDIDHLISNAETLQVVRPCEGKGMGNE